MTQDFERALIAEQLQRINNTLIRIENQNRPKSSSDAIAEIKAIAPEAFNGAYAAKLRQSSLGDVIELHAKQRGFKNADEMLNNSKLKKLLPKAREDKGINIDDSTPKSR